MLRHHVTMVLLLPVFRFWDYFPCETVSYFHIILKLFKTKNRHLPKPCEGLVLHPGCITALPRVFQVHHDPHQDKVIPEDERTKE